MPWRTTRWKVCRTKCSSENIALLCPKNPPWQRRSPARGNYWNTERNRVGCRARLGDDNGVNIVQNVESGWSSSALSKKTPVAMAGQASVNWPSERTTEVKVKGGGPSGGGAANAK